MIICGCMPPAMTGSARILVVDDKQSFRFMVKGRQDKPLSGLSRAALNRLLAHD
jgi:hypothetical protein